MSDFEKIASEKAESWIKEIGNDALSQEVLDLKHNDLTQFIDAFYTDLEFGTGGLRGKMGLGTNRMNPFTVRQATAGFAAYLRKFHGEGEYGVAIAYDSRKNSFKFAMNAAGVLAAAGFRAYVFQHLRPTPELSFAVRNLGCKGGIVITASHNPPIYNGYKVYWEDGAQVLAPHDKAIITSVRETHLKDILFDEGSPLISHLGTEMDELYIAAVCGKAIEKEAIRNQAELPIVYTALHGTGICLLPEVLKRLGFTNVHLEPDQAIPNGDFPTVKSPNPEEPEALQRAILLAKEVKAELVLGTDPDSDRVGIAVRKPNNEYVLLNANETGAMLMYYQLSRLQQGNRIPENGFVAITIVTSPLMLDIAAHFGVKSYETLTGFKYIAGLIREKEGKEQFITGGEESYGYMIGDFVRDKDGIAAAAMICEMFAWLKDQGKNALEYLEEIHRTFGAYKEALISLQREGLEGKKEIDEMMQRMRNNPPLSINEVPVEWVYDYLEGKGKSLITGEERKLLLPSSDVIQYWLKDGSRITGRPSGTEPKVKFYVTVRQDRFDDYAETMRQLQGRINLMVKELNIG
ncbi:MAG: hypothetical protein RL226_225 [Bacteroidota bacterium]|jgi:phosphoglucomutase